MTAAGFLSCYLSGPLPYVLSVSLNKTFPSFLFLYFSVCVHICVRACVCVCVRHIRVGVNSINICLDNNNYSGGHSGLCKQYINRSQIILIDTGLVTKPDSRHCYSGASVCEM